MDDRKTPEELEEIERIRQLILQRRNRFIAAALAGIGAAAEACDATGTPSTGPGAAVSAAGQPAPKVPQVPLGGQSGPRVCLTIVPLGGTRANGPAAGGAGSVAPPTSGAAAGAAAGSSGAFAGAGGQAGTAAGAGGQGGSAGTEAGSGGAVGFAGKPSVCLSAPIDTCPQPGKTPPCVCLSPPYPGDAGTRNGSEP